MPKLHFQILQVDLNTITFSFQMFYVHIINKAIIKLQWSMWTQVWSFNGWDLELDFQLYSPNQRRGAQ